MNVRTIEEAKNIRFIGLNEYNSNISRISSIILQRNLPAAYRVRGGNKCTMRKKSKRIRGFYPPIKYLLSLQTLPRSRKVRVLIRYIA